jgi:hypothetical protein
MFSNSQRKVRQSQHHAYVMQVTRVQVGQPVPFGKLTIVVRLICPFSLLILK